MVGLGPVHWGCNLGFDPWPLQRSNISGGPGHQGLAQLPLLFLVLGVHRGPASLRVRGGRIEGKEPDINNSGVLKNGIRFRKMGFGFLKVGFRPSFWLAFEGEKENIPKHRTTKMEDSLNCVSEIPGT